MYNTGIPAGFSGDYVIKCHWVVLKTTAPGLTRFSFLRNSWKDTSTLHRVISSSPLDPALPFWKASSELLRPWSLITGRSQCKLCRPEACRYLLLPINCLIACRGGADNMELLTQYYFLYEMEWYWYSPVRPERFFIFHWDLLEA